VKFFLIRRKSGGKFMGSRTEEKENQRFRGLETIVVAVACLLTAIICAYVIYSAM
jgi:hypothetical protein